MCAGPSSASPESLRLRQAREASRFMESRGYRRTSSTARVRAKRTRGARITCLSTIARRSRHTRASCQPSAATTYPAASAALHSPGLLDVPQWVRLRRPSFVRLAPAAVYGVSRRTLAGRPGWDAPDEGGLRGRKRAERTRGARITCLSMIARRSRGGMPPTRALRGRKRRANPRRAP